VRTALLAIHRRESRKSAGYCKKPDFPPWERGFKREKDGELAGTILCEPFPACHPGRAV